MRVRCGLRRRGDMAPGRPEFDTFDTRKGPGLAVGRPVARPAPHRTIGAKRPGMPVGAIGHPPSSDTSDTLKAGPVGIRLAVCFSDVVGL